MVVKGYERVREIAERFSLPDWWVEAILVEYYTCRRFLEVKEVWLFDFNLVDEEMISTIPSKKVIIGDITLFHNITQQDLAQRMLFAFTGDPIVMHRTEVFPEGPVNPHYVHFLLNPIDVWDPKLAFNERAIVFDGGTFYQWKIATFYPIEGSNQGWFKSDLFDLANLKTVNDQIQNIRNTKVTLENKSRLKEELRKLYEELEEIRGPLRLRILEYHESKKSKAGTPQVTMTPPLLLTPFDSVDLQNGKYKVRTFLEPLLYRASLRNLKSAKEAAKKRVAFPFEIVMDEIEYSAICILCSHGCLEAYINSILQDYCSNYISILKGMSVIEKWFMAPRLLGSSDCFILEQKPFADFIELNSWRNSIVHYTHEWKETVPIKGVMGEVSKTFSICNSTNAEKAVKIIHDMIEHLSEKTKIPKPRWLDPGVSWLKDLL